MMANIRGQQSNQPKRLSDAEREAIARKNAGLPYNQRDYNSGRQKEIYNEKVATRQRNQQKRQSNFGEAGAGAGAGGGFLLFLWWLGKGASPLCGPAMPACAFAF